MCALLAAATHTLIDGSSAIGASGGGMIAYWAHKKHCSFAPVAAVMEAFRKDLEKHKTTKCLIQFAYDQPLPEDLIREVAGFCLRAVSEREDKAFW